MERSESSDSDSNSSSSWVFVADDSPPAESTTNTFHLDCSREPIQELTEQDFISAGSDIESESDGVSVISESDATNGGGEGNSDDQNLCQTLYGDFFPLRRVDTSLLTQVRKFMTGSNIVGVGVVLTAVFLGSYSFKKPTEDDTSSFMANNDLDSTNYPDLPCKNSDTFDKELEDIVDITIACTYNVTKSQVHIESKQIKQCVRNRYENKQTSNPTDQEKTNDKDRSKRLKKWFDISTRRKTKLPEKASVFSSSKHTVSNKIKETPHKPKKRKTIKETNRVPIKHTVETGEWYSNLHKARQRSRKQANKDIYINKKIQTKWYFKWMNGREELRGRRVYKPDSIRSNFKDL